MSTGLTEIMKRAAMDAVTNAKLTDLRYGEVKSVNPLKVQISNQFTLPASMLIVPQHLTDYNVEVEVNWTPEVSGTKTMKIKNALKVGDKVALIRQFGGQSYLILDRI